MGPDRRGDRTLSGWGVEPRRGGGGVGDERARLRERYEADGAEGLIDRRRGCVSGRRVPVDRIEWVPAQYRTHHFDFTAKQFHERLVAEHGFELGYTWTKLTLQRAGLVRHLPGRSAHRKRRPRRPLPGMLLFVVPTTASQDGSRHAWLAEHPPLDRIVTMDDATSAINSAVPVEEEGTFSSFRGWAAVIAAPIGGTRGPADRGRRRITTGRPTAVVIERHGLFSSLDTNRDGHYFHTPRAGGKVAEDQPTEGGRTLRQLGIAHIPSYSEARGRMERVFGTLQRRLPQELRLAGH